MRLLISLVLSFSILLNAANCDQNYWPIVERPYNINNFKGQVLVIVEDYPYGLFKYNVDIEMNLYRSHKGKVDYIEIIETVNDYDSYLEELFNIMAFGYIEAEYYYDYKFKFRKYDTDFLQVTKKNQDYAQDIINDFLINYEFALFEEDKDIVLLDRVYKDGSSKHYTNPLMFWIRKTGTIYMRDLKKEFRND